MFRISARIASVCVIVAIAVSCRTAAPASGDPAVPLVQPGAPGEESHVIPAARAVDASRVPVTQADVRFMQGMIHHHAQAVDMADLLKTRTESDDMRKLGLRIEVSQKDEIKMMQRWLEVRGQEVPGEHAHHMPGAPMMPGMLTEDEMSRLAAARGAEFDRLFLEGMIKHHAGALTMVHELFASAGAAQDSEIFGFASDVDADQRMEIDRMGAMLNTMVKEQRK